MMKRMKWLVPLIMMIGMIFLSAAASAETLENVSYQKAEWNEQNKKVTYSTDTASAQVVTADDNQWGTDGSTTWYVVSQNVASQSSVTVSGTVNLILVDGCELSMSSHNINLSADSTLNIYAQSSGETAGKITVTAPDSSAGIEILPSECINIHGGKITVRGGTRGAGIGSASTDFLTGYDNGTVNIYGGTVEATGGETGAGIGGGNYGSGGTVTIYSGTVTANGGHYSTGIGGGYNGSGGTVTIYGGEVTATGGSYSAGIGGGAKDKAVIHGGTVTIYGGEVTATGGSYGAGIGGGSDGYGGTVTIHGGTVEANGGVKGAGIGGGRSGAGGNVTINGGIVIASAGTSNDGDKPMGIGHGFGSTASNLENKSLDVGNGISVFGSDDNSTWTQMEKSSEGYARKRYMKVWSAVTGITLDPDTAGISCGNVVSLTATVSPTTALDPTVLWSAEGGIKLYSDEACTTEVGTGAVNTLTVYVKGTSAGSAAVTVKSYGDTSISATCSVTVTKGTPTISTVPTASDITVGDSLSKSTLTGGTASVEGTFAWKDSTITPAYSDSESTEYTVVFTPKDSTNYNTAECSVKVKVNKNEEGGEEEKLEKKDLTVVPEALKELFDTLQELKQAMLTKLEINGTAATENNTAFYDVKLLISLDGGKTWAEATADNFPAEGIPVTLDYPAGTNADDYDFSVCHMFTLNSTKLGTKAGDTESPAVTKTAKGLRFTLKGLSPLAVAWAKSATPTATAAPTETAAPTATAAPTTAPTTVPKTGDHSSPALWIGLAVLGFIGIVMPVLRRRRSGR